MKETKKVSIVSELAKQTDPEKRYSVIIEYDQFAKDGYEFFSSEDISEEVFDDVLEDIFQENTNSRCGLVFYFKAIKGKHNKEIIVESISGTYFEGRRRIIEHFITHHALRYAVQMDGFYKNL